MAKQDTNKAAGNGQAATPARPELINIVARRDLTIGGAAITAGTVVAQVRLAPCCSIQYLSRALEDGLVGPDKAGPAGN